MWSCRSHRLEDVLLFKLSRPERGDCDGATFGVGGLSFMRTTKWVGLKPGNSLRRSWNTNAVMKHPNAADGAVGSDRSAHSSRTFLSAVLSLLLEKLRSASTHCWRERRQLFAMPGPYKFPLVCVGAFLQIRQRGFWSGALRWTGAILSSPQNPGKQWRMARLTLNQGQPVMHHHGEAILKGKQPCDR